MKIERKKNEEIKGQICRSSLIPVNTIHLHIGPKIKFYFLFAIAYLPTLLPPTQLFFCFSRTNFFFFGFFDISVSV